MSGWSWSVSGCSPLQGRQRDDLGPTRPFCDVDHSKKRNVRLTCPESGVFNGDSTLGSSIPRHSQEALT